MESEGWRIDATACTAHDFEQMHNPTDPEAVLFAAQDSEHSDYIVCATGLGMWIENPADRWDGGSPLPAHTRTFSLKQVQSPR